MRTFHLALATAVLLLLPSAARAGLGVAVSLGSGYELEPRTRQPTSLMVAPGYALPWVRAEVGVLGLVDDVDRGRRELQLRPMLVIKPPLFPLYVRGILALTDLGERPVTHAYGGALGLSLGLGPLSAFLEGGALALRPEGGSPDRARQWAAEGRVGLALGF